LEGGVFELVSGPAKDSDVLVVVIGGSGLFEVELIMIFLTVGWGLSKAAVGVFSDIHDIGRSFIDGVSARLITTTDDWILLMPSALWNVRLISHL
jgi:hypothetical protein